jgi:hypothetical protein
MFEDIVIESITSQVRDELTAAADNDQMRRAARGKPKPVSQRLAGAVGFVMARVRRHVPRARVETNRLHPPGCAPLGTHRARPVKPEETLT